VQHPKFQIEILQTTANTALQGITRKRVSWVHFVNATDWKLFSDPYAGVMTLKAFNQKGYLFLVTKMTGSSQQ
jgi:hypothetical protein